MCPQLFNLGPLPVYSYGLMLGIAFIVANYFLTKEVERRNFNAKVATEITLLSIVFGIVGSKLFHLFENWSEFLMDPIGMAFSPGGLTFYGGLILATLAIYLYARNKKIPFPVITDIAAGPLAIAYGIGRIGCHLAGDGDYGIPTSLPWGTNYENGVVKPSIIFSEPQLKEHFPSLLEKFPQGVSDSTPLHPTPVYEFISHLLIFILLWKLRKNSNWRDGKLFMLYLILSGTSRLLVEFIRLNPRLLFNLSEAQLISVGLIIIGIAGFIYYTNNPKPKYMPKTIKVHETKKEKGKK